MRKLIDVFFLDLDLSMYFKMVEGKMYVHDMRFNFFVSKFFKNCKPMPRIKLKKILINIPM